MQMTKAWKRYFTAVHEVVKKVEEREGDNILKAAEIVADCIAEDGLVHVFGTGHSHMMADEVFWRSATLAPVHAILETSMTGSVEITKSNPLEKLEGAGEAIVDYHRVQPPDVMIVISNSGNNAVPIEVARSCQERKVPTIVINSTDYSDYLRPLHSSGKKLKDMGDVVIDNCTPIGDAAVELEGFEPKVGPTSTIPGVYIINAVLVQAVENLLARGIKPDVYYNGSLAANSQEAVEHNNKIVDKYFYRIRNL